jgi:hypothetical protein
VILPPGRARLATMPSCARSSAAMTTMGIVVVACLAASALGVVCVTITCGCCWTNSAARLGSRSHWYAAKRYSRRRVCPST